MGKFRLVGSVGFRPRPLRSSRGDPGYGVVEPGPRDQPAVVPVSQDQRNKIIGFHAQLAHYIVPRCVGPSHPTQVCAVYWRDETPLFTGPVGCKVVYIRGAA